MRYIFKNKAYIKQRGLTIAFVNVAIHLAKDCLKKGKKRVCAYYLCVAYDKIYEHYDLFRCEDGKNGLDKYTAILDKIKRETL